MEIKQLEKGKQYRIKGTSPYFKGKYGNSNPLFRFEGTDVDIWDKSWGLMSGNPCAMLFGMRAGQEGVVFPLDDLVCYGQIKSIRGDCHLSELVHPSELEEV